nr:CAunnamed protein product [Biomphalaria glabrata]
MHSSNVAMTYKLLVSVLMMCKVKNKFAVFAVISFAAILNLTLFYSVSQKLKKSRSFGGSFLNYISGNDVTASLFIKVGNVNQSVNQTINQSVNQSFAPTDESSGDSPSSSGDSSWCTFPQLDPFDSKIRHLLKAAKPIDCSAHWPNLVYADGDYLYVNMSKVKLSHKFKHCRYVSRARHGGNCSDRKTKTLYTSDYFTTYIKVNETDTYVFVECLSTSRSVISRSYITLIRKRHALEEELYQNLASHRKTASPKKTLSVIMLGLDGMSKQNFQRTMPKTREFLERDLQAVELRKFNKIGLNTFPNFAGLLAGRHEEELKYSYNEYLDKINDKFIWSPYRKAGYRTFLMLDSLAVSAFHYLKLGWMKPPVDYYVREMVIDSDIDKKTRGKEFQCYGDKTEIETLTDLVVQFAMVFNHSTTPYFSFSFLMRQTHDQQHLAAAGDILYFNFLRTLVDNNLLTNTLLIFFSDHGPRFGAFRQTLQGMIEGRTPYFYFVFPAWFKAKYPEVMKVLSVNQDRLTSHFDVHETLMDILNFQGETGQGELTSRGISLFKEIPRERTCEHIGVPVEYCACVQLSESSVAPEVKQKMAKTILYHVISLTEHIRKSCAAYTLTSVNAVLKMSLKKDDKELYALLITTNPGNAVFEGYVTLDKNGSTTLSGHVIRASMYGKHANCINDLHLRNYCYCRR